MNIPKLARLAYITAIICIVCAIHSIAQSITKPAVHVKEFENTNHPEIAYWFFNKSQVEEQVYKSKIDSITSFTKYTMVFLTARNGLDFFDPQLMYPVFSNVVKYAHSKGLKVGLQLWGTNKNTSEESSERCIVEQESVLDDNGQATIYSKAKHIRAQSGKPFRSNVLKVYAFRKTADGVYAPNSCKDITSDCRLQTKTDSSVTVEIKAGASLKGYQVYLMSQHYYRVSSNHSQEAIDKFVNIMKDYRNIPFDGVGLDEYTNLKLFATWELQAAKEPLRERLYSPDMAKKYKALYNADLERALFDMRYAPANDAAIRIKAINSYMDLMRKGTLNVETAVYDNAKEIFGPATFAGLHDSHHNHLDGDEVWQTGINWWNVKREYGHSDEGTPTATQMGIAFCYPKNILYNMFYNKDINVLEEKAYNDLAFGIRTHYHAINDVQNWGVSVERPDALAKINPVENCARMLNHFNPSLPEIKLLVVFGREALMNWYPDSTQRGICDINDKLKIEEKAEQLWKAGYLNALVPTDVIDDRRLVINNAGKPVLNGHVFDAMIFLYPEYAKETTLAFLELYTAKGGKLMLQGNARYNFLAENIETRWKNIAAKAQVKQFNLNAIEQLGIRKNNLINGYKMEDGSFVFRDYTSFKNNTPTTFAITIDGNNYEGQYMGYAAIAADKKGISKIAATKLQWLKMNGNIIMETNKPADIFIDRSNKGYSKTIAGSNIKLTTDKLL